MTPETSSCFVITDIKDTLADRVSWICFSGYLSSPGTEWGLGEESVGWVRKRQLKFNLEKKSLRGDLTLTVTWEGRADMLLEVPENLGLTDM